MTVTVYADFTDPLAYLLSQRLDAAAGAQVRWCAVERDRLLPATGAQIPEPVEHELLSQAAQLALPGEHVPEHFAFRSHSRAAVSAYAESVTDGRHDALRRALFAQLFVDGADLSSAYDVRGVVAIVMCPELADPVAHRENPRWAPLGVPDPMTAIRQMGGTTTRLGGPLTTAGQRRVDRWREEWRAQGAPSQVLLVSPLGERLVGARALAYAARLLPERSAPTLTGSAAHHVVLPVPAAV